MSKFQDLREFVDRKYLDLPVNGTVFRIYDVDGETWAWLQKLTAIGEAFNAGQLTEGAEELDDASEESFYRRLLGDTYDELIAARGVDAGDIKVVAQTAYAWVMYDEDVALKIWEAGGDPEGEAAAPAQGPNRQARRASAAAAKRTPSRASTSGTRASKSATRTPSRGKGSSPTGR